MAGKIELPSTINEDCWFYKDNEELCKPHLGKPYISNSSIDSWENYQEDFIKQKFIGIKLPDGTYAKLGNYVGEAVENGEFGENSYGFTGQENLDLDKLRPKGAEYEKMILIAMGEYVIIGFIDVLHEYEKNIVHVRDMKTGGKKKEDKYSSKDYIQVILYACAIEQMGYEIGKTDVYFIRRTGSHFSPPLNISEEQFVIPLEYSGKRVDYALKKVDKIVKEISLLYGTYKKFFVD
jgi:hypothetical protein